MCHGISCSGHPRPWTLERTHDGRSPGLRISVVHLPSRAGWHSGTALEAPRGWTAIRSQLRGQPRFWSLLGRPHRVPY
ncbi:hypothetical protein EKH55_4367 [Sinorhizobium alkalisoli]|nr:hypothetical protein EKH55_4367 [Sinorhizobium alkalisoli]